MVHMKYDYYRAAIEGNIEKFQNHPNPLSRLLTSNENTILHVHLKIPIGKLKIDFVNTILDREPTLLLQSNKEGETPLHIAAENGHYEAVVILINRAKFLVTNPRDSVTALKQMLRTTTNQEKETALHKAARKNHRDVASLLIEEDPSFLYSVNDYGETPIYIAAVKGYLELVFEIFDNCAEVDYKGPGGRTALHAAVINNDGVMVVTLLAYMSSLATVADDNGCSPLHYAAYFGWCEIAGDLISLNPSVAYIGDKDKNRTPFHVAALQGNVTLMTNFKYSCPDCPEQVDNRGWNALHYVVASKDVDAFRESVQNEWLRGLVNKKDNEGNTPLHLFAASHGYLPSFMCERNFEVDIHVPNKQNLSVSNLLSGKYPEKQKEIAELLTDVGNEPTTGKSIESMKSEIERKKREKHDEAMRKIVDQRVNKANHSHLVAATLISTVTFAATFTLPGGYKSDDPNKGTAILDKNPAFTTFVIADAIAMVLSTSAVFIHFRMALLDPEDWPSIKKLFFWATMFTMISMGAMTVAFATGTYCVLRTTLWLAITTCFVALSFFGCVLYVFTKSMLPSQGVDRPSKSMLPSQGVDRPSKSMLPSQGVDRPSMARVSARKFMDLIDSFLIRIRVLPEKSSKEAYDPEGICLSE